MQNGESTDDGVTFPSTGISDCFIREDSMAYSESFQSENGSKNHQFDLWQETKVLLHIAAPAVIVQFSMLFIFPQTAAVVGRTLGTESLAGFSLGSLVGNLTCVSILTGALTAADTLQPRAFATRKYPEMGILSLRAFLICSLLLTLPIVPLCTSMEWVFDVLGQNKNASHLASQWIRIYLLGVPAMLLFRVVQSFLNAQQKVWPMVYTSVFASYIFHPVMLKLLVPRLALNGSALAIAITQWIMSLFLVIYVRFKPVHAPDTWPGISKSSMLQAIEVRPMLEFMCLSLGGVLSLSEWWFWESTCFIVGTLGVVPLVVHTIAYNLVPLLFMPTLGIMMGLTVRIGHVIAYDTQKAKLLAAWSLVFNTVLGAIFALSLYIFQIEIMVIFSDDDEVIQSCKHIWPKLCYFIFVLHIFGINSSILRALGLQWRMATIIFVSLWFGALPSMLYFLVHHKLELNFVWIILPTCYSIMQIFLGWSILIADWELIGKEIHRGAQGEKCTMIALTEEETKPLLPQASDRIRQDDAMKAH